MSASSHDSRSMRPSRASTSSAIATVASPQPAISAQSRLGQLAGAGQCEREREPRAAGARAASAHSGACACGRARHEEGARDGVDEHSGILAYARPWNQS